MFVRMDARQQPMWHLQRIHLASGEKRRIAVPDEHHHDMVTALVSSPDGSRLASADGWGNLYPLAPRESDSADEAPLERARAGGQLQSRWELVVAGDVGRRRWNRIDRRAVGCQLAARTPSGFSSESVEAPVWACHISPDNQQFAYSQNADVVVRKLANTAPPRRLACRARALTNSARLCQTRGKPTAWDSQLRQSRLRERANAIARHLMPSDYGY